MICIQAGQGNQRTRVDEKVKRRLKCGPFSKMSSGDSHMHFEVSSYKSLAYGMDGRYSVIKELDITID